MKKNHYWFRKPTVGLGWEPNSREGWLATGILVLVTAAVIGAGANAGWGPLHLAIVSLIPVAFFIPIAVSKCEP